MASWSLVIFSLFLIEKPGSGWVGEGAKYSGWRTYAHIVAYSSRSPWGPVRLRTRTKCAPVRANTNNKTPVTSKPRKLTLTKTQSSLTTLRNTVHDQVFCTFIMSKIAQKRSDAKKIGDHDKNCKLTDFTSNSRYV